MASCSHPPTSCYDDRGYDDAAGRDDDDDVSQEKGPKASPRPAHQEETCKSSANGNRFAMSVGSTRSIRLRYYASVLSPHSLLSHPSIHPSIHLLLRALIVFLLYFLSLSETITRRRRLRLDRSLDALLKSQEAQRSAELRGDQGKVCRCCQEI